MRLFAVMKELSVELIEISFCGFLVRKYFYDLLPFHDFFDKALLRRERALLCDHVFGAVSAHSLDDGEHDDGTKPYDQSEPKAVPKHGTNTDSHSQTGGKERRKALSDELAHGVGVVSIGTHNIAVSMRIEIFNGKGFHSVEHILAEMAQNSLRDDGHNLRIQEGGDDGHDV